MFDTLYPEKRKYWVQGSETTEAAIRTTWLADIYVAIGDPALDGPVEDAIDMITRLANSERVEQVFVRHAFRYWMGRNETIHDAPILQEAHQAYKESGGSMQALITSLVTSDAFLYRTVDRRGAAR